MSSVNAFSRGTCEVHELTIRRDTPGLRRTFDCQSGSESEYWRSRASRYLDVAAIAGLAGLVVLLLDVLFPVPFPLSAVIAVVAVVAVAVVVIWCRRNYVAAMDFAVWSLEAGHES